MSFLTFFLPVAKTIFSVLNRFGQVLFALSFQWQGYSGWPSHWILGTQPYKGQPTEEHTGHTGHTVGQDA